MHTLRMRSINLLFLFHIIIIFLMGFDLRLIGQDSIALDDIQKYYKVQLKEMVLKGIPLVEQDRDSAYHIFQESLRLQDCRPEDQNYGVVWFYLGHINQYEGNFESAILNYKKAIEIFEQFGAQKNKIHAKLEIAKCESAQGNQVEAYEIYTDLEAHVIALNDTAALYKRYNLMHSFYSALDEFELAYEQLEEGKEFAESIGPCKSIYNAGQMVGTLNNMDSLQKAEKLGLAHLPMIDSLENCKEIIILLQSMALLYDKKEELEKSEYYFNKLLAVIDSIHFTNDNNYYAIIHNYARTLQKMGKEEKAAEYFKDVYNFSTKAGRKELILESSAGLSNYYEHKHNYKKAFDFLTEKNEIDEEFRGEELKKELSKINFKKELNIRENKIDELEIENREMSQVLKRTTILFIGSILALLISTLLSLIYYQRRRLKDAEIKESVSQNKLAVLRANMNPHFIYNSLNAAQNLILKSEKFEAYDYLSKFAELTRDIYNANGSIATVLEKELQLVENYLELEKRRFRDKFDYHIINQLESNDLKKPIPAMVIQPLIENAIIHGFPSHIANAEIQIRLLSRESGIMCEIIDNGIGREASRKNKLDNNTKHLSMSTENMNKRLKILNRLGYENASVNIIDLYESRKPSGTKVIVNIPFIHRKHHTI